MTTKNKPYLPGVLAHIAAEIGQDVAVRMAEARGGRELYIPKNPKPDSELSKITGLQNARRVSALLGHGTLLVPCGNLGGTAGRRARILELFHQGLSHSEIAAKVDVHVRTVERATAGIKDDREPELPF